MAEKSGTSIISLPQGGGALKGIGETFAPDLFTGTGNFSVPIALPPGRNGFQPDLSLVYSTGNGNGPFGLGWGLSVPGVSRKTSKGIPRYDNTTDVFILSGAEDLVPVFGELPGEMQYRPRTEGLFALITFRRDIDTNDSFWEVRSKDGLVSRYGTPGLADDDPATVADPADASRVFVWKLTQTVDPFGNRIEYEYERDRDEEGPHHWDQLYLKQIRYVDFDDKDTGEERFLVTVTFYYEERPDPFSDYRAGFEIRTRKRCKEIVVETHPSRDKRIRGRTYALTYLDELVAEDGLPPNRVSLLSQIQVIGHDDDQPMEADRMQELPPLTFGYTKFEPQSRKFSPVAGADLPAGSLADPTLELTSLFGNGLTDIFEMNGTVRYWRNLGGGVFDRPREMRDAPAGLALADPGVQLIDANGDGRVDLMVTSAPLAGYFPLTFSGAWDRRSFQRYRSAPSFDLEDPEVKLVDLDGDGVTDAIRSGSRLECFFNDPKEGWTRTRQVERRNLEDFPNVSFSDPRIKWADMSGDGLQNVVLVHDGHIDYWPNLGYGDWGKRVSMRNSPRFPFGYDPKRILLGDVDGDGLADLLYVDDHRVTLWINQSGNGWSAPIEIHGTPGVSDMDSVRLDDLRGTGIAGALWSGVFSAPGRPHMFFLDLTGGTKPYLVNEMNNHMGAVSRVRYASSTEFYLADQAKPATRWRTALPFPVQVVAAVEVTDEISGGKLTTEYIYHHGYWDGGEREFRGFGRVDQRDTEVFDDYNSTGLHPERPFAFVPRKAFSPPTENRTWFHLGPVGEEHGPWEELDLSHEYWSGDSPMAVVGKPNEVVSVLQPLPRRDRRDAVRALRGRILRTELYALDGSDREDRPYTITEFAYGLREEDRPDEDTQAERLRIFFPHTLGQRTTKWERGDDPMTAFSFTDGYDEVGQPRLQTQIACPRGWRRPENVPAEGYLATHGRTDHAHPVDPDVYIMDRVARTTSFEILETHGKTVQQVKDQAASGSNFKVIGQVLNYYEGPAFIGRAFGEVGAFGVLVRTETLIMTEDILREAYSPPDDAPASPEVPPYLVTGTDPPFTEEYPLEFRSLLPPLAGYIFHDGKDEHQRGFFANTARNAFDFQPEEARPARGLLRAALDPLSQDLRSRKTTIDYDRFDLLPTKVTDPIGLVTLAEYDERILQPSLITDPNGNQRQFSYTPLGLLQDVKMMGKVGANEGDIEAPTVVHDYGLLAFMQSPENARQPIFVRTIRRCHHDSETDVPPSERDGRITTVEFSDGFDRLIQKRTQAEDVLFGDPVFGGQVLSLDQNEIPTEVIGRRRGESDPDNVVVSGWQIFDNKGRVVEKFEPLFSKGYAFAPPVEAELGQKVTLFYDARGQMIRTVNPDGSEKRVVFGVPGRIANLDLSNPERFEPTPWEAFTYDENDNAGRTPDAPGAKHVPATHLNTPASMLVDVLGRTIQSVERNGPDPERDWFTTVSAYDIRGNVVSVTDALDRPAVRYSYDLANRPLRTESIDAGIRRAILNATGNDVERRDAKGGVILQAYDDLNRPIRFWARDDDKAGGTVTLRQRLVYGDGGSADQPPQAREANRKKNRLGALHQHFDEAGQFTFESYDFKGNVLEKARHVIGDEAILAVFPPSGSPPPEGGIRAFRVDWDKPNAEAQLDPQAYETSAEYDALNRAKLLRYPRDEDGERKELQPQYNRAGALEQVRLAGELFVDHIAYDAKGQRTLIALGNKTITLYAYQPQTFRLGRQTSVRCRKSGNFSYQLESVASEEERKKHLFQECAYERDLVGNIVALRDRAPDCGLSSDPHRLDRPFAYDALYRLTSATGRECDRPLQREPWNPAPRCTDLTKTRKYTETYDYDPVGNMLELRHGISGNGFTRNFDFQDGSNRLASVTVGAEPGDVFRYTHDANGNLIGETTSRHFEWDHSDHLKVFGTEAAGNFSLHAHYLYDAVGLRVKKLVRNQAGQTETVVYIDGLFEHHRRGPQGLMNNTLHVMDDQKRIATVRAGKPFADDRMPDIQFHLSDHLDSSTAIIDEEGTLLNREEYTPCGETSFGSFARKQYRFGGKERDEESGLYYHGVRYYAPWIARWLSVDPEQPKFPEFSPFSYAFGNPMRFNDPVGLQPNEAETAVINGGDVHLPQDIAQGSDGIGGIKTANLEVPGETIVIEGKHRNINGDVYWTENSGYWGWYAGKGAPTRFASEWAWFSAQRGSEVFRTPGSASFYRDMSTLGTAMGGVVKAANYGLMVYSGVGLVRGLATLGVRALAADVAARGTVSIGRPILGAMGARIAVPITREVQLAGGQISVTIAKNALPISVEAGLANDAKFAQKTYNPMFDEEGKFALRSVDDVAAALRSGSLKPSDVPIDFIVRDGQTLILNTRSSQALEAAGIPRSQWNAVNRTGQDFYEGLLEGQLSRNPGGPFDTVRRSGTR